MTRFVHFRHNVRFLHKWVGLLLGFQLVIWLFSGFMMSWLREDVVKGHYFMAVPQRQETILHPLKDITFIRNQIPAEEKILKIDLKDFYGKTIVQIDTDQITRMFDTKTGLYMPVTEAMARQIAEQDFSGPGKVVSVRKISAPTLETRDHTGSAWRVDFDNREHSSLYISAQTGVIWARRNDIWRLFDFFWMLHIMDYWKRENINNWIVILSGWTLLWLTLSGVILLIDMIRMGRFNFLKK